MTITVLLQALYLFLPAFAANAAPVVLRHVPGVRHWKTPIAARHLGLNKTWRGAALGMASALFVGWFQGFAGLWSFATPEIHADPRAALLAAVLLGAGALCGDAVESFAKRRLGFAPGAALPVVDNIDYVLGGLLFLALLFVPSWTVIVILLVLGPLLSVLANVFAYLVGWKQVWW